jgi:hypothetical protein
VKNAGNFHERFDRQEVVAGSERSFGYVIAGALVAITFVPLVRGNDPRWYLLPIALIFAVLALFVPAWLRPLNRLWYAFGLLLQKVVNPVVMLAIFVLGVVPTGLILRSMGKDPMGRKFDANSETYWITRDPPGPPPGTMKNQF